ncbi:MAG: chromate transporter [Christensenellales bacterium]|jgi:chromate transporter
MNIILHLFFSFLKIGLIGFGGGYSILSIILAESASLGLTIEQFADLNVLDLVVPGPIAINSATYVGYLSGGVLGSITATVGVCIASFILVPIMMYFLNKYKEASGLRNFLAGVKPATIGLIAAAAFAIAIGVLQTAPDFAAFMQNPFGSISYISVGIFIATLVASLKFDVNPILLTVLSGVAGAFLLA